MQYSIRLLVLFAFVMFDRNVEIARKVDCAFDSLLVFD